MKKSMSILGLFIMICLCAHDPALGATKSDGDVIVDKSRLVLEEMMLSGDQGIPRYLIERCEGLVILPDMLKGGFVVGGSYGKGVLLARKDGSWTGPAFVYIGAGSLGFQIGLQSTDLILVIMGKKAVDSFLQNKYKLGADAAIAAGPVGAQATAATEIMLKGGIFSYSRSKGLFAGVSLEGAAMGSHFDLNRAYYGTTSSPTSILHENLETPPSGKKLIEYLDKLK